MHRGIVDIISHEEDRNTVPSYISFDENGNET
jgi:molecular chaperone DnaK (HSP70)